jgi:hypothetical protein
VYKVVDFRPQLHAQEIFSIELFQTVWMILPGKKCVLYTINYGKYDLHAVPS